MSQAFQIQDVTTAPLTGLLDFNRSSKKSKRSYYSGKFHLNFIYWQRDLPHLIRADKNTMMTLRTDSTISGIYSLDQKTKVVRPLFSSGVSAGFPSPAEDYIEQRLDLNELLIRKPAATFFVRVNGDSMVGAGINHNDILIVDRSLDPTSGQIVIAIIDGEFTVKRMIRNASSCKLVAENPDYPPIEITEDSSCEVWGVVTSSIHQF